MLYRLICNTSFIFVLLFSRQVFCDDRVPSPQGWVSDFAGVINKGYTDKLNSLISELEEKTTAEIAVVTMNSIAPYGENEYARMLFDKWKPGKKGKDNGVLILLAIKERRWRIETGYGIEGTLPDGLCGEIGRNYMVPYFKEGRYSEGLYYGSLSIAKVIAENTHVRLENLEDTRLKQNNEHSPVFPELIFLFAFSTFLFTSCSFIIKLSLLGGFLITGAIAFSVIVWLCSTFRFFNFFPLVLLAIANYLFCLFLRYISWLTIPLAIRKGFFKEQDYSDTHYEDLSGKRYGGSWGSGVFGGGGFGGGGGGGGFGGGGGGGGGAGGGF